MATAISQLKAKSSGKLPSQTVVNPRENASAIVLRTVKEVEIPVKATPASSKQEKEKTSLQIGMFLMTITYQSALAESRKNEQNKDLYETFSRCEVNIPLLDAIKQVPRYAKFLKELCTIRRKQKLKGCEKVRVGENVLAIIQRKLPAKCKDPVMFTMPCTIGNTKLEKAMLDLGASINVMPYSIYVFLKLGPLNKTGVMIQLADRSIAYPKDVVKDVLVQVNDLVFPADFYVLDMENDDQTTPISLGRPFLKTSKTKIDVHNGTLTMEFDGEIVKFNIYEAMKYPDDDDHVYSINVMDSLALSTDLQETVAALNDFPKLQQSGNIPYVALPVSNKRPLPSVLQAPILDLKPVLSHLKYMFLGDGGTLEVIISSELSALQEENLVLVLKEHKMAIGWTIADIKGISLSICMIHILLEEGAKTSCQPQRRLNSPMIDAVKKEILKLLEVGVIYPISDSNWVSPVHVIPKKTGIIVVKNQNDELVPTRIQNGWRVCIDYRKLNVVTRKDHFPLPFIDQMLERFLLKIHQGLLQNSITPMQVATKDVAFEFNEVCKKAFDKLKELLTSTPIIQPPDWNVPFEIMCDASDYAIGTVLGQRIGKASHAIYYVSRTLNDAQRNYSTTEKELLAIVFALEKFRFYLLGTKVNAYFDHAALRYLMMKKEAKPRLIRSILLLSEFDLEIKDRRGTENRVVDHLSHLVHMEDELRL
ncbi:uncharacterized protein LOC115956643 [Quercus lobata]|uniref:uncharacterized protein LOC115956643 n=1 Tax=Quercus lobata TaxID=97700 RepID=UPI0012454910|nr:uncharacterized protein LOC115956643 [Quercus lobata]